MEPIPIPDLKTTMTLRDYFAAKAMAALIAGGYSSAGEREDFGKLVSRQFAARCAYDIADAMLVRREIR
jgi:hypothetical protein